MKINFPEVYSGWKTYKYKVFLVHIFPYLDWDLRRFTEIYGEWSSIFSTNTGKYGPENSVFWHYSCKLTPYFVLCQCIFPHIDLGAIFQKSQILKKTIIFYHFNKNKPCWKLFHSFSYIYTKAYSQPCQIYKIEPIT